MQHQHTARGALVLGALLVLGLALPGCDHSNPAEVKQPAGRRVAIDLRPLHQRVRAGVPEGCVSLIASATLSVNGQSSASRDVTPAASEVVFEVEVDVGEVLFEATLLSPIDSVLYAGSRRVLIEADGFNIPLQLQQYGPVPQVCPDTLRLSPQAEELAVTNAGLRTLAWEVVPPSALCEGQPCLTFAPPSGRLESGATALVQVKANTAAAQRFRIGISTQVGEATVEVETVENPLPAFTSEPATQARANARYAYEVHAADPEDERVALRAVQMPGWLAFTDNGDGTGLLAGTPTDQDVGTHEVVLEASDSLSTVQQAFTVTVAENLPPAFATEPVTQAEVGQPYTYSVQATDPESDPLTLAPQAPLPAWLAFTDNGDGTGLLAGTPGPNDVGESPVMLAASDGSQTVVQDFVITVSLPPPPEAVDDVVVTNEEGPVVIEVLANDRAPNPETLSIVEWTRPSAGEVSLTDAGLRYVPARDATGLDVFSYTISDEYGQTDQASVQVQVNACIDFDALTPADLDVGPGFFFEEDGIPVFVDTFYFGTEGVFDQVLLNDAADFQEVIGQGQVLTTETVNLFFDLRNAPVPYLSFAFLDRTGGGAAANVSINEDSLYVIPGLQNGFQAPEGIRVRLAEIGLTSFGLRGRVTLQATPPASIQSLRIGGTFLSIDNVCAGEAPSP